MFMRENSPSGTACAPLDELSRRARFLAMLVTHSGVNGYIALPVTNYTVYSLMMS